MSLLKNLIVILSIWAYALQAAAGVASPCQQHPVAPQAALAQHHEHLAGQPHSHAGDQVAPDCDHCKQCAHDGCSCSDHSCSSSPGITSAGTLGFDVGAGVVPRVLSPLDPSQAFPSGLIRPPSIS